MNESTKEVLARFQANFHELAAGLSALIEPDSLDGVSGSMSLAGGFIIGLLFGVVLQKGRMSKYDVVSGLFRLQDFTVFRLGTPLIIVAMILIYVLTSLKVVELHVPATAIVPQILGGLLFGVAIAIMGYCPGTAAAALGEGDLDAIPAILGMITGSVIFAEFFFDSWSVTVGTWGDLGNATFPELLNINPWFLIILMALMATMFLIMTTMFDWMIQFLKKSFNIFMDLTDTIEIKTESARGDTVSYFASLSASIKKLAKSLKDLFSR